MKRRIRRKHGPHFRRQTPPGAPPGEVRAPPQSPPPAVRAFLYGPQQVEEVVVNDLSQIAALRGRAPVLWLNVEGLGSTETILTIGQVFALHPLALEDVVHVHQRAKAEHYEGHLFLVARMVSPDRGCETEQCSLFLGNDFVITFLEDPGDAFDFVRMRLKNDQAHIRQRGAGYLAYALLDAIVDAYFPVVEAVGDRLDDLEDRTLQQTGNRSIAEIHATKHDLRGLRRALWPLRDMLNALLRDPSPLLDADSRVYLRDCHDHTVQILDLVETYRELCSDLTDLYLSSLSNRLNEVMKLLTIMSTIFMPIGVVASVYGMNFEHMPELHWKYGYAWALGLMVCVGAGLVGYFFHRGWLLGEVQQSSDQSPPTGSS